MSTDDDLKNGIRRRRNRKTASPVLPPFLPEEPTTSVTLGEAIQLQRRAYMKALMLQHASESVLNDFGGDPSRGPSKLLVDLGAEHGLTAIPPVEVYELAMRLAAMADQERQRARRILRSAQVEVASRDVVEPLPPGPAVGNLEGHEPVSNSARLQERVEQRAEKKLDGK